MSRRSIPRRSRLRACGAATGCVVALALGTGSAQAADSFACIATGVAGQPATSNLAPGIELGLQFTRENPLAAVGQHLTIQPTINYKLSNAYLEHLAAAGVLTDTADDGQPTEHKLGGMTFWVAIAGSNTVEQKQVMRATVNPSANTRVNVKTEGGNTEVWIQRWTSGSPNATPPVPPAPTGPPMQELAGTADLNTTGIEWTPASAAPVSFSLAPAGSLGSVPVQDQWRRNSAFASAPTDTVIDGTPAAPVPDVDPLTVTRPYGSVLLRLRLGGNGPSDGRTSLDCVPGTAALLDYSIPASPRGNVLPADGGDRGRYTVLPVATTPFLTLPVEAAPQRFQCIDGLGRYRQREVNQYSLSVRVVDAPGTFTPGAPYTPKGTKIDAQIDSGMIKALYATLYNYQQLPAGGNLDQPITLWLAVKAANTAEQLQVVKLEARWQARFVDPDGVIGSGDETFPPVPLEFSVPDTTWTPTGDGPIEFSVAAPGQIPELTLTGRGHSGAEGAIFPMWPYGSLFIRAETGRYGASIDCVEGTIAFADLTIPFSNLGRRSPDLQIPTPVPAGDPPTGNTVPAGSDGRYAITYKPAVPFATVPAVVTPPAPAATPPADTAPAKPSVGSSGLAVKRGAVAVSVACPATARTACAGTVQVRTVSRYALRKGGKRKLVTIVTAKRYSVAAGKSASVSLSLSASAKKLLRQRKSTSLRVLVTVAPGVMRTLTLKG